MVMVSENDGYGVREHKYVLGNALSLAQMVRGRRSEERRNISVNW
jgi:hypothetical protein